MILADGELEGSRTVKNFLTVRQEGKRQMQRDITYYNQDMIIALGYRIQSPIAVRFRLKIKKDEDDKNEAWA